MSDILKRLRSSTTMPAGTGKTMTAPISPAVQEHIQPQHHGHGGGSCGHDHGHHHHDDEFDDEEDCTTPGRGCC